MTSGRLTPAPRTLISTSPGPGRGTGPRVRPMTSGPPLPLISTKRISAGTASAGLTGTTHLLRATTRATIVDIETAAQPRAPFAAQGGRNPCAQPGTIAGRACFTWGSDRWAQAPGRGRMAGPGA